MFLAVVLCTNLQSCNISFSPASSVPSDLLLQFFQPKFSMNLSSLSCVQNDFPISFSLIYRSNDTGETNKRQLGVICSNTPFRLGVLITEPHSLILHPLNWKRERWGENRKDRTSLRIQMYRHYFQSWTVQTDIIPGVTCTDCCQFGIASFYLQTSRRGIKPRLYVLCKRSTSCSSRYVNSRRQFQ